MLSAAEPEFRTVIIRVILIGGAIVAIGVTGLYFAFRAFGEEDQRRPLILTAAVLAFIAFVCVGLLVFSLK